MRVLPSELLAAFAASAEGTRLWLPGLGRSMKPLLRSGDAIEVERSSSVRRGDIVLMRTATDLVAHLVESVEPLRTMNLRGKPDAVTGEVLGRAITLRRGETRISITPVHRELLRAAALTARTLRSSAFLRDSARSARDLLYGRRTSAVRRKLLGGIQLRRLMRNDLPAVLRFCGDHLDVPADLLTRQLTGRWNEAAHAFGAFSGGGELVAFSFIDDYAQEGGDLPGEWVRFHFVAPIARHLGVGEQLAVELVFAARSRGLQRLHADVRADNPAALRLFGALGFQRDDALTAAVNRMRNANVFVALVKDL